MNYGIPYMGSKSGIMPSLALNFPAADHFYDLFGGGFSVSHYMIKNKGQRYKHFHYNEIKSDVVELVKRAIAGEFNYDVYKPEWISREDFFKRKETDGYVRCLWSFGNNQEDYLFSEDIEPYKKSMHQAVVFGEFDALASEVLGFSAWPARYSTVTKRRLRLRSKIEEYRKSEIPAVLHKYLKPEQLQQLEQLRRLQQLQQLERLEQLQQLEWLQQLERLGRLQQLEQLQRLQQLQQLKRLSFYSDDYRKINIMPNSVVYCDTPYSGTTGYISEFNHADFFDWAASRPFPVFFSEYAVDDQRFKCVYAIDRAVKLAAKGTSSARSSKSENLYWNGK